MVDLAARHRTVAPEVEIRVLEVLRSGRWTGGPVVAEAEAMAASLLGRARAVGVASGTDALMLALQACGIGPGDEVLVPALTFFATAGAVIAAGASPVIVDVGPDALIDPASAAQAVGSKTRAVIPVHLFGNVATMPDLGLTVIDDAAQAVGSPLGGVRGGLTAVSTYPTKNWGAAGDGGFVAGDDAELVAAVRSLATHGQVAPHVHESVAGVVGRVSRLDPIQAAVLLGHAPTLGERLDRRRRLAERYDAGLPEGVRPLKRQPEAAIHQYCVLVEDRATVIAALENAQIGHAVYYPRPLDAQPALAGCRTAPTPTAHELARQLLALPIRASLTDDEVDRVLDVLTRAAA